MRESLIIKNLGPLSNVIMDDIRAVLVLVGASGSEMNRFVQMTNE